jgi:SH3-like domain-containing protein
MTLRLFLMLMFTLSALLFAGAPQPAVAASDDAAGPMTEDDGASAQKARKKGVPPGSGLPVPRFVTLRSNEVNARIGPGRSFPVEWIFTRKEMPVEIIAEFDTWRRIRDWEGSQGWVHQSMLSGKRGVVVLGGVRSLRRDPTEASAVAAYAQPGVMGKLLKCKAEWCQVDLKGHKGWLTRKDVWGVYAHEKFE